MNLTGAALLEHYNNERLAGQLATQIAAEMGVSVKTLEKYLTIARKEQAASRGSLDIENAKLFKVDIGAPWLLHGDYIIVGDVHVPCTDYDFALHVADVAECELPEPRRLIVAGDWWNFDAWSKFPAIISPPEWKQERAAARALISRWRQTFASIELISGNHDWRRIIASQAVEDAEDLLDLLKSSGLRWSIYKWCWLVSGDMRWRITHPRNFSQANLTVAEKLAQKHNCNVLGFHEHHLAQAIDRYGHWVIANGGCLVDDTKLAYVQLDDPACSSMVKGFAMIRSGRLTLFGDDRVTDWKKYKHEPIGY